MLYLVMIVILKAVSRILNLSLYQVVLILIDSLDLPQLTTLGIEPWSFEGATTLSISSIILTIPSI